MSMFKEAGRNNLLFLKTIRIEKICQHFQTQFEFARLLLVTNTTTVGGKCSHTLVGGLESAVVCPNELPDQQCLRLILKPVRDHSCIELRRWNRTPRFRSAWWVRHSVVLNENPQLIELSLDCVCGNGRNVGDGGRSRDYWVQ